MPVQITRRASAARRLSLRGVQRFAQQMLVHEGFGEHELSVLLCDDRSMRALNARYRGQRKATDVLAFPASEKRPTVGSPSLLGDVVISLDTAARQAKQRDLSLRHEVVFLLAHGLLHLLGMDHDTPRKAAAMNRRTATLLRGLGLAPPPRPAVAPASPPRKRRSAKHTRRRPKVRSA